MSALATLQIGLIASSKQTSGSDRYYFSLLRALRDLDVDVSGVVLGDPASVADAVSGVVSFAPDGSSAMQRWTSLRRTVRSMIGKTDLIVSHLAPHVFPVLDIVKHVPLVEHFHGPWALEGQFGRKPRRTVLFRQMQERMVYSRAKRIIVLSRSFGDVLEKSYGIAGNKIRLVPGGADVEKFGLTQSRAKARDEFGLPLDRRIVVTVRRLESTKGVDRLIAAIDIVRRDVPDVLLIIAGTGSLRSAFERQVREARLEPHVGVLGMVEDHRLPLLYRSADLSVVPSIAWEGFGLVCIESLASGTPVLVTPVGGLPEAVAGLDPSLVLRSSTTEAIADGLRDALLGRVPLPSDEACRTYARGFAWPEIARRVREVYREVA